MAKIIRLKIEKLVFGGQGLAKLDDKVFFVWNALPGEEVEAEILKDKKTYAEAIAREIITPSPERLAPREAHFLVCSPWQIMSFETENRWKIEMARETYQQIGKFEPGDLAIEADDANQYAYRNKIEYSFAEVDGKITLAFFERGKKFRSSIDFCDLASTPINETAAKVLTWINEVKVPMRSLKTLIVRSNELGETIAALFIKDKLTFDQYPKLDESLKGFQVYYSTHKSPASVVTDDLYSDGQNFIVEQINGMKLKYGLLSFFQINVKMFTRALADIGKFLDAKSEIVDYYSGVGAIGLTLHEKFKSAVLVENNEEAVAWAKDNIIDNKIKNCRAKSASAEKMLEAITKEKIIILDPPRAGLHRHLVERLLETRPRKIIYLSCNLSTQARDLQMLSESYEIKFTKLYNFFPRTPHVEGLCVLERK